MFLFNDSYETFEMFGVSHILYLFFFLLLVLLLYVFKEHLKRKRTWDKKLRWMTALFLLLSEWTFYTWSILSNQGVYDLSLLPLGLCAMSLYLTVFTLLSNKEKAFKIVYPWAVTGGLMSLFVADMSFNFPHFRFFHFFLNHSLLILVMLYFIWVRGFIIVYKDILHSSLVLFIISMIVFGLNFIIDTNHLFLRALPDGVDTLFLWMGYPLWVFAFICLIFFLFNLLYLPFLKKRVYP